jgi:hypothetical protein
MSQTQLTKQEQSVRLVRRIAAASKDFDFDKKGTRTKVKEQLKAKIALSEGCASTYYANIKNGLPGWSIKVDTTPAKPVVKAKKAING